MVVAGKTVDQPVEDVPNALQKRFGPPLGFRPFLSKRGQAFGDFRVGRCPFGRVVLVLKLLHQISRGALKPAGFAETTGQVIEFGH